MITMIFDALTELGPFGCGTLIVAFLALCIGLIDDEKVGTKPGTMTAISSVVWTVAWIGGIFFVNGRGILW